MSDTRDQAEQELVNVGIADSMEEDLGSSLSSSLSLPPPPPKPAHTPEPATKDPITAISDSSPAPIQGLDQWKDTYEQYQKDWLAESAVARTKAEKKRAGIEKEMADLAKDYKDKVEKKNVEARKLQKEKEDKERLDRELGVLGGKTERGGGKEDRERKVKEAWEMVRGGEGEGKEDEEIVVDGRGVMPQDVEAGQASVPGHEKPRIKQTAYDPTTSTEPLPPSMQDPSPSPSPPLPTESRHSTTSQAWVEVSASSSSAEDLSPPASGSGLSGEEMMNVPRSKNRAGQAMTDPVPKDISSSGLNPSDSSITAPEPQGAGSRPQNQNTPPSQPPSLTLSVFTMPSHLTFSRMVAVLGINLVLPFINGVMLGFGEIFSREVVRFGKAWWRSGTMFGRNEGRGMGGRGTSGVGLSGSGGF